MGVDDRIPRRKCLGAFRETGLAWHSSNGVVRGCATTDEAIVARRANYDFEKRQKEIKRQQKRDEKAAKKKVKREIRAGGEPSDVTPAIDNPGSVAVDSKTPEAAGPES